MELRFTLCQEPPVKTGGMLKLCLSLPPDSIVVVLEHVRNIP